MKKFACYASIAANVVFLLLFLYILQGLGGVRYVYFKVTHDGQSGVEVGRSEVLRMLDDTEGEIVFLGDSITQQMEWSELFGDLRYKNRGIDGNKSKDVLRRIEEVTSSHPQKVFLMVGINDLGSRTPAQVAPTIQAIAEAVESQSPETMLFVQSVLPVNNLIVDTGRRLEDIRELNAMLSEHCRRHECVFIDLFEQFADESGALKRDYTYDGIHLNGEGYRHWRSLLLPYLDPERSGQASETDTTAADQN